MAWVTGLMTISCCDGTIKKDPREVQMLSFAVFLGEALGRWSS